MKNSFSTGISTLSIAIALSLSSQVQASGFQIIEHSVSGLGTAFAGNSVVAEDASTIFFNPAGMTYLKGTQAVGGAHIIVPGAKFKDGGSNTGGTAIPGDGTNDGGKLAFVPNFYYSKQIDESLFIGLGINAPFGLATEYDDDWVGRYHAIESALQTVNINPSIAFKVNDKLSVGAGINIQYMAATLTKAVDFGRLIGMPYLQDGNVEVTGDSWGYGFNLGAIYQPTESTRIGLSFRSKVEQTLEGEADFTVPAAAAAILIPVSGRFTDTDIKGDITTPETVSLSFLHKATPRLTLLVDASWTNWSRFKELRIKFDNPTEPDSVKEENWKDTMRYSFGGTYQANDKLVIRFGTAYDESPISGEFRTARIPGNDRTWLTVGAGYQYSKDISLDVGYAYLIIDDTDIDETNETGNRLIGKYKPTVHILSTQATMKF